MAKRFQEFSVMSKSYIWLLQLLLFLLLLSTQNIKAQPYQAVLQSDSTSWDLAHYELFGIEMEHLFTKKYHDSLYAKLYLYGLYPDTTYTGKVREDTINGKIWYKDIYNNLEKLIMDMNLNLGDTFQIIPNMWSNVDSVFFHNGRKIIRFELQTKWDEPVMFIEGVGPNISLLYTVDDFDKHYAACKYDLSSLVYVNSNQNFDACQPKPVGFVDNSQINNVFIYPNPAANEIYVELPEDSHSNTEFTLSDFSGKIVLNNQFLGRKIIFHIGDLHQGIYFVTIINSSLYYHQKILIIN